MRSVPPMPCLVSECETRTSRLSVKPALQSRLQGEIAGAQRQARVAYDAAAYVLGAALANTDASARGLRTGLERCRTHCARAMFWLRNRVGKKGGSLAIEQAMLSLPFLPGSLFGGRLPQ